MVGRSTLELPLIGWQEWVALPDLGLSAIKAKVDTGAKTSALHATRIVIDAGQTGRERYVSFDVQPMLGRPGLVVSARAKLLEMRTVTSSNGSREERPTISTRLRLGEIEATIELTLTDRAGMRSRMLLGRQALTGLSVRIDPSRCWLQSRLSYRTYPGWRNSGLPK